MNRFLRHSDPTRDPVGAGDQVFLLIPPLLTRRFTAGSSACCCPAPAQYAVYLTAHLTTLNPAEILLCAHHLRTSAVRLARPDVAVYDGAGRYVDMQHLPTVDACESIPEEVSTGTGPSALPRSVMFTQHWK